MSESASPIVFFDVAGSDTGALRSFYGEVFGWTLDSRSRMSVPVVAPLGGSFRSDPAEMRIYIGVPDVTETLRLVQDHGGSVERPRFEVPGVVVLGLFRDPAGNPLGVVEMEGGSPKIPRGGRQA